LRRIVADKQLTVIVFVIFVRGTFVWRNFIISARAPMKIVHCNAIKLIFRAIMRMKFLKRAILY